ncbi:hypothetical protein D3C72_1721810 [compost metagenome]
MPPTPWMPNTSSASSARSMRFRPFTPQTQTTPATTPMISAPTGPTRPAAGVMPTRPAIAPEAAPSIEGLPLMAHSVNSQASTAPAVAIIVLKKARVAFSLAASAEPALKPNQPTHSRAAPTKVIGRLCGCIASRP